MTGTTGTDAWGASRAGARQRRRWLRKALTVAAAVTVMAVASLIGATTTTGSGVTIAPLVTAIGILAIAAVAFGLGWREADEVLRRRALHVFAAVGVVTIVGNPVAEMLGKAFRIPAPSEALWWLSLAAGAAVLLVQRLRDRAAG